MQQTKYYNNAQSLFQYTEEKNKQIKTHETDTAWREAYYCRYVPLYSWPLTFLKVVRQQIWGEVAVLNPHFSADSFWI